MLPGKLCVENLDENQHMKRLFSKSCLREQGQMFLLVPCRKALTWRTSEQAARNVSQNLSLGQSVKGGKAGLTQVWERSKLPGSPGTTVMCLAVFFPYSGSG